jgi:hypothetical protein
MACPGACPSGRFGRKLNKVMPQGEPGFVGFVANISNDLLLPSSVESGGPDTGAGYSGGWVCRGASRTLLEQTMVDWKQ